MRIYGKRKEIAPNYYEVEYKEIRPDGTLKQTGTEDFTRERLKSATDWRNIYTWDGQRRNKGGARWFEYRETVRVSKGDLKEVQAYARRKFADCGAVVIECRKF